MLRRPFDQQQRQLQDKVLVLGSQVEEALQEAIEALKRRDKVRARRLLDEEWRLHQNRARLETDTLALLSTQQPMAGDLRFLAAVFQICLELGQVACHAREIAKISLKLEERVLPEPFVNIGHMANAATKMLRNAMEAFSERDTTLAQAMAIQDNEVDDLYAYINQRLLVVSKSDSHSTSHAIHLSQVAHQLERVGDRATNICEWVIYAVTGHMVEMNVEISFEGLKESGLPSSQANV